jgi:hypothetical protein
MICNDGNTALGTASVVVVVVVAGASEDGGTVVVVAVVSVDVVDDASSFGVVVDSVSIVALVSSVEIAIEGGGGGASLPRRKVRHETLSVRRGSFISGGSGCDDGGFDSEYRINACVIFRRISITSW